MSKYLIENLFGIEGWSIAWYGVIIAVGMVFDVMILNIRLNLQRKMWMEMLRRWLLCLIL